MFYGRCLISHLYLQGVKQRARELGNKGKSFQQARKIRSFDEDFDTKEFAVYAQDLFIEAHDLLQE